MQQTKCLKCGSTNIMHQHLNHEVLDGEVQIQFDRPPAIKLSNAPKIVFAIPIGSKKLNSHFVCDPAAGGCGSEWMDVPAASSPNLVPVQIMFAYQNMQLPLNVTTTYLTYSGTLSSIARQIMTKRAIELGAQYIVYWDDDVIPPMDAAYKLYNFMEKNPKVGITAAVCTTRMDPVEPVVYMAHGDGASWDFECGEGAIPAQIFASGGAFTIARVSAIQDVIEKIKADNGGIELPVWADEQIHQPVENHDHIGSRNIFWGHDVRFYRLMQEAGYYAMVHGGVLCGHLDIQTGKVYEMPADAPGFKMVQERLNAAKKQGAEEGPQGDEGVQPGDAALGIETGASSH